MPSYAFRVNGIEPRYDVAWIAASEDVHRAFWQAVVGFVLAEKDAELAAGKDRFGKDMVEIAESTKKKGRWRSHTGMGSASAPPLDPAYRLSRTRSLFTGRAHKDHAEFYWKRDEVTGLPWGKVLGWHRAGVNRPGRPILPARDVIGLSLASLAKVRARADAWWAHFKAGKAAEEKAKGFVLVQPTATPARPAPAAAKGPTISFAHATFGIGSESLIKQAAAEGKLSAPKKLGELPPKAKPPGGGTPAPKPAPKPKPIVPKMAALKPAPPPKAAPPKPVVPKPAPPPKAKPKPRPAPPPVRVISPPVPKGEPIPPKPPAWQPRKQSEFEKFTSAREMERFGEESFKAWADSLTPSEAAAIKLYASDNYKWMNAILRGKDPAKMLLPHGLSDHGARDYIARTVAPLARGRVDRDIVTYRGIEDAAHLGIDVLDPSSLTPGKELVLEGFASTTLKVDKANDFAVENIAPRHAILQLNIPKGTAGGYLNAGELSGYSDERELLLPPGARFRFVRHGGIHKDVWGNEVPVLVFERVE